MVAVVAILLAQLPALPGRAELRAAANNDDPGIVLRVANGFASSANPQGSWGEALTFTRASAWTCPNDDGTVTQLASGVACTPKGTSGTPYGYRIRPAVTNVVQFYNALGTSPWSALGSTTAPTVTNNTTDVTAPDGSSTATKIVYPAVSGANAFSFVQQTFTGTAAAWTAQTYYRTLSGTVSFYEIFALGTGGTYHSNLCTVTTTWAKCVEANQTLTAAGWVLELGTDLHDGTESATTGGTVYAWGAQAEVGAFASDVCPTAGASATCNEESLVSVGTFTSPGSIGCESHDVVFPIGSGNSGDHYFVETRSNSVTTRWLTGTDNVSKRPYFFDGNTGSQVIFSNTGLFDGAKHHLAYSWSGTTVSLLIDGVSQAVASGALSTPLTSTASTWQIGSRFADSAGCLNGNCANGGTISNVVVGQSTTACP